MTMRAIHWNKRKNSYSCQSNGLRFSADEVFCNFMRWLKRLIFRWRSICKQCAATDDSSSCARKPQDIRFTTVAEARSVIQQFRPELVFQDIVMPEKTGLNFKANLRTSVLKSSLPQPIMNMLSPIRWCPLGKRLMLRNYVMLLTGTLIKEPSNNNQRHC